MKKFKSLAILLITIILVTGCGSTTTLTCNLVQEEEGMKMNQNLSINFKDDHATNGKLVMKIELSEEVLPYKSMMAGLMESSFKEGFGLEETDGVKFSNKDIDKGIELTIDFDFNKIKEDNNLLGEADSFQSAKETFEEQGYTCK